MEKAPHQWGAFSVLSGNSAIDSPSPDCQNVATDPKPEPGKG